MAKIDNPDDVMKDRTPYEPWGEQPDPTGADDLPDETAAPPGVASLGRTGDWRVVRPVMPEDAELCSRCCQCWLMCPEGAITLDDDQTPHIDYEYCKGCMICAEVCPKKCIDEVRETETTDDGPSLPPTP